MCRSTTEFPSFRNPNNRHRLTIRSFVVGFSGLNNAPEHPLPPSLTLVYLPRINENVLEVSGSKIRPDSPAFVSLHRGVAAVGEVLFGSRDRAVVSEGVRFEVYLREEKVLKGSFGKDEDGEWRLECCCAMERELQGVAAEEVVAEVRVSAAEEGRVMRERVAMAVVRRRRMSYRYGLGLEEIPEEREEVDDYDDDDDDGRLMCDCDCSELDGRDWGEDEMDGVDEMDMEGIRWAVDVGIWVMCLGVGFLVSKASSKTLRRRRIL